MTDMSIIFTLKKERKEISRCGLIRLGFLLCSPTGPARVLNQVSFLVVMQKHHFAQRYFKTESRTSVIRLLSQALI